MMLYCREQAEAYSVVTFGNWVGILDLLGEIALATGSYLFRGLQHVTNREQ